MPEWLLKYILPYAIQFLTPVLVDLTKKASGYALTKLPRGTWPIVASALGEGINQVQTALTGAALPPGVPGLIAIVLNEFRNDFVRGMKALPR